MIVLATMLLLLFQVASATPAAGWSVGDFIVLGFDKGPFKTTFDPSANGGAGAFSTPVSLDASFVGQAMGECARGDF